MDVQSLTLSERIILVETLWDSIISEEAEIELTEAQKQELNQRLADFKVDQELGASWASAKARILSKEKK